MRKEAISHERWLQAQEGELPFHQKQSVIDAVRHYDNAYSQYFKYLEINNKDLKGKSILEIGPAKISALLYCENYSQSFIVEPCEYNDAEFLYSIRKNIEFIRKPYEDCEHPFVDEIWILNLLQHVKDPDALIEKAKKSCRIIRFFEPIDLPVNNEHPFSFSLNDFENYFGSCVQLYNEKNIEGFHSANCAYGVYVTGNV